MTAQPDLRTLETSMPEKTSMNPLSFDRPDAKFTILMAGFMSLGQSYYGKLAAMLVIAVWVGFMWRREDGRNYRLLGDWWMSLWIARVEKNLIWTAKKKRWSDVFRRSPPINIKLGELGDLGLIHVVSRKTDSIVITGDGSDSSSQNLVAQHSYNLNNSDTIKRVAAVPGYSVGTSFVFRRRLSNISKVDSYFGDNLDHEVAIPRALTVEPEQYTDYDHRKMGIRLITEELRDMVQAYSGEVDMAAVLTIRREGILAALKKGGSLAADDIHRLPIAKVARAATDGFVTNGVSNVSTLDFPGAHAFVQGAWNIAHADEYYRRLEDPANYDFSDFPGPEHEILAFSDHCITDDTLHSVIKLTQCPAFALPNFFRQLHATNVRWPAVTLVGDAVGSGMEYTLLDRHHPAQGRARRISGNHPQGPQGTRSRRRDGVAARGDLPQPDQDDLHSLDRHQPGQSARFRR